VATRFWCWRKRGGLSCFFLQHRPTGARIRAVNRLKDKLGNARTIGEMGFSRPLPFQSGRRVLSRTIMEMVSTRLDCAVASVAYAHGAGARDAPRAAPDVSADLIDQPAMRAVLADIALELEAAVAVSFRLAQAFDLMAGADERRTRLMTPAIKYLVCKRAPALVYEALSATVATVMWRSCHWRATASAAERDLRVRAT
jgi:putative acyl-CoA dehydrogenase